MDGLIYVVLSLAALMILGSIGDWILSKAELRNSSPARHIRYEKWIDWCKWTDRDGRMIYVLSICLPQYRYAYQVVNDELMWSQRVLIHHTVKGWLLIDVPVVNR